MSRVINVEEGICADSGFVTVQYIYKTPSNAAALCTGVNRAGVNLNPPHFLPVTPPPFCLLSFSLLVFSHRFQCQICTCFHVHRISRIVCSDGFQSDVVLLLRCSDWLLACCCVVARLVYAFS